MNGDVRLLVVAPLQLIFGCKLLAVGVLLWPLVRRVPDPESLPFWPLILALVCLAGLQLTVLVGITLHRDSARRLGVGLSIAGLTIALVLCVLAPLAWYFAIFVLALGLILGALNGVALALLRSEPAREWCGIEATNEAVRDWCAIEATGGVNEAFASAVAGATVGGVAGGLGLAVTAAALFAAFAVGVGWGIGECTTGGAIVGSIAGAAGGALAGWCRASTGRPASATHVTIASAVALIVVMLAVWGALGETLMILALALVSLGGGAAVGDRVVRRPGRPSVAAPATSTKGLSPRDSPDL